jgi:hypothetical protein
MGFFSYRCNKTNLPIPAWPYAGKDKRHSLVVMILPNDEILKGVYNGYGKIIDEKWSGKLDDLEANTMSIFDHLERVAGLNFDDFKELQRNVKIMRQDQYNGERFSDLETSAPCETQGYFSNFEELDDL